MTLPGEPFPSIAAAALGMILGSFLNVCIHRLPLGESVIRPGSRCPSCRVPIPGYRNVPVLSWLLQRGRCASCGARISWRYPLVELLGGALVLVPWRVYGATAAFPIVALFGLSLVVLFFTDFDHQLLPDAVTLSGLAVGLAAAWFNPFLPGTGWMRVWAALAGAALGSGLLWTLGAVYGRWRGVEAMGLGDVKMMAMVGAFSGPLGVLATLFAASLVGAAVGLLLIPLCGRTLRDALPFGCFLAPAALAALLFGRTAVQAYFKFFMPGA
ncbi:MAG TPA: prepilin peptidase [Candidatus Polarisedimenticolaceae bacterium]|nr:prepilin peptidase [Candidatus Polarisedimenticolaceae bacterium]